MEDLELNELKAKEDLRHSLGIYNEIGNYETRDEIYEGVATINDLIKNYRHVHVELKATLGEEEYNNKYPTYEATLKTVSDFLKSARNRLKMVKHDPDGDVKNVNLNPTLDEKIEILRIEQDVLDLKKTGKRFCRLQGDCDVSELNEYIQKMESFLNDYFDLSGQHKCTAGEEYDERVFELKIQSLSDDINAAKISRKRRHVDWQKYHFTLFVSKN